MRHGILWTLVLLGLPHVAAADDATGRAAALAFADQEAAISRSKTSVADPPPTLDLRIVPPQPSPLLSSPTGAPVLGADRGEHDSADPAARGLSFGVELQRRRPVDSRAWLDEEDAPGLQDDIQRLIEQSTLGVRGSYRF